MSEARTSTGKIICSIGGLVLLAGAVCALAGFRSVLLLQAVTPDRTAGTSGLKPATEQSAELAGARAASEAFWAGPEADIRVASVLLRASEAPRSAAERIDLYCQALKSLNRALKSKPYDTAYLIAWSNIRQIIGQADCGPDAGHGDFASALVYALKQDPTNVQAMYSAALMHNWSGEKAPAQALLGKFLLFNTASTAGEEGSVLTQIQTPEDFKAIVPARFPQILRWTKLLRDEKRAAFSAFAAVVGEAQVLALQASRDEFDKGLVTYAIHRGRVIGLLPLAANDTARMALDAELSELAAAEKNGELADYFNRRRQYFSLDAAFAVLESDTRPLKGNLSVWGTRRVVYLDEFHKSLGFYLPEGHNLKLIELSSRPGSSLDPALLQVYVSDDNQVWSQMGSDVEVKSLTVERQQVLALDLKGNTAFRYWKVHFASPERSKTFSNEISELIRLYGYGRHD